MAGVAVAPVAFASVFAADVEALGMGLMGLFLAVAAGITAYGLLAAQAVRAGVWGTR